MPLQINLLVQALGIAIPAATEITKMALAEENANQARENDDDRRGSLVMTYAQDLQRCINNESGQQVTVAVILSTLNCELHGDIKDIGGAIIGGWGYTVYIAKNAMIVNKDENKRGYCNWSIAGYRGQKQIGNKVYTSHSCWECLRKDNGSIVGKVDIWWGHKTKDAEWACNKWCEECNNNCFAQKT